MCRFFLKHCTLTNKAVGTTRRALSKHPHICDKARACLLWLIIGNPTTFGPSPVYKLRGTQSALADVTWYFELLVILISTNICVLIFYDLSTWDGCWSFITIWRFIYKFSNVCHFDCTAVAGSRNVGPWNIRQTTTVGRLLSLHMTIFIRSLIVV